MTLPTEEMEEFVLNKYEGATMPSMALGARAIAWHISPWLYEGTQNNECTRLSATQGNTQCHTTLQVEYVRGGEVGSHHTGRTERPA